MFKRALPTTVLYMANENSKNKKQQNSESEILLAQIESLTKSGTWELDLVENNLSWSDGVFQMLDYKPQEFEVTFEKGVEVIYPADRERATALMEDVLQNDQEYFIEKRLVTKTGNIIHVRSKANIFKDKRGNPIKLRGFFRILATLLILSKTLKNRILLPVISFKIYPLHSFFLIKKDNTYYGTISWKKLQGIVILK